MPVNDNFGRAQHHCNRCGSTDFMLIDNKALEETMVVCSLCGNEHMAIESEMS